MKRAVKLWLGLAGSAALVASVGTARAERISSAGDGLYNLIPERNVFDLHDPIVAVDPPRNDPALPKIYLTGIATILGDKRAYFVVKLPAVPGKPGPGDKYMTLGEGQHQEMLEVLEIDPLAKQVKIKNSGTISTITFETGKIAFSGAPGNPPGSQPGGNGPMAGGGVNLNIADHSPNPSPAGRPPQMEPEQQVVLMELQREATKSAVANGTMPPLPPTPLSDILQQEQQQSSGGSATPAPTLPSFPGQHNTIK